MSEVAAEEPQRSLVRRITGSPIFHLVLAFIVMSLVLSFVAKPYVVPSGSMENTLQVGDRVIANRLAYVGADPQQGDIVVFDADESWGMASAEEGPLKSALRWVGEVSGFGPSGRHTLVKRIIATPGQTVSCCSDDGRLLVDGKPIDEPYVFEELAFMPSALDCDSAPASARCLPEVVVPEGSYLVLGDHRGNSADGAYPCRAPGAEAPGCYRWAHRDDIVGRASVIAWPISRWQGL